ncbi:epoxide hydrolase family protein [Nocardia sp. NPDC057030]|uniref:epoxide hydrolase family protein n=1 Tax=unclassified Nocardia TaxID=2637762 RepID=UPI003625EE03
MNADIIPFRIRIPQVELDDLRDRLSRTRSPYPVPGTGAQWDHGIAPDYLRDLASYWADGFDWRAHETELNTLPHFVTEIDGQTIHFVHLRSPEPGATPLLLNHSYPTSFVEFRTASGPLTDPRAHGGDPADAFHLVIPSLPGFAFSSPLSARGWHLDRTAEAALLPDRVIGAHTHGDRLQLGTIGEDLPAPAGLDAEERKQLQAAAADFYWEMAHAENTGWGGSSPVPQGQSLFHSDPLVRKALGAGDSIAFFRDHAEGGHFPAFEVPELFTDDIRSFFRQLRE